MPFYNKPPKPKERKDGKKVRKENFYPNVRI